MTEEVVGSSYLVKLSDQENVCQMVTDIFIVWNKKPPEPDIFIIGCVRPGRTFWLVNVCLANNKFTDLIPAQPRFGDRWRQEARYSSTAYLEIS